MGLKDLIEAWQVAKTDKLGNYGDAVIGRVEELACVREPALYDVAAEGRLDEMLKPT
jgi:hypothetical protein